MNATDILRYGQLTFLHELEQVPHEHWLTPGVVGTFSVKDVVAHITSFELVLADLLGSMVHGGPTPLLDDFKSQDGDQFNEIQVGGRRGNSIAAVMTELENAYAQVMTLIAQIPVEKRTEVGTIPWYGPEYALDDFLVYANYGHKREHSAQIGVFRDHLA